MLPIHSIQKVLFRKMVFTFFKRELFIYFCIKNVILETLIFLPQSGDTPANRLSQLHFPSLSVQTSR